MIQHRFTTLKPDNENLYLCLSPRSYNLAASLSHVDLGLLVQFDFLSISGAPGSMGPKNKALYLPFLHFTLVDSA